MHQFQPMTAKVMTAMLNFDPSDYSNLKNKLRNEFPTPILVFVPKSHMFLVHL